MPLYTYFDLIVTSLMVKLRYMCKMGSEDGLIFMARPLGKTLVNLRKLWIPDLSNKLFYFKCA